MADDENGIDVVLEDAKKQDESLPEVEIVDEKPEKSAKKASGGEVSTDEGISDLKKSLEREKQARIDAERRAQEAQNRAQQAHVEKTDSDYQLVVNAIETVKGRKEQLKNAYADAMNVQDFARAAELQSAINLNDQQLSDLKRGKKAMKEQREAAEKQPIAPVPQGDVVENIAARVSPRSAAWLRDSKDYIKTDRDVRKMVRAHEDAVDDGISPDSDEYFEYIEQRLGIRRNADESSSKSAAENPMSAAAAPRRAPQPPPAPVSRGSSRPNVMRLTKAEADTATALGMTPEEYAKNKYLLQKEGRYGH